MRIASKTVSAVKMVEEALEKAKRCQNYNIFVSLNEENALKKAKEIDEKIARGEQVGRLAGVPYALKDNFLSKEGATTASSKILEPFKSPINATAVELLEKEDAIMIGRANMDSFAHGTSTENSYFGPTKNAKDIERVSGGSSGGSAVAVALDIVQFATGTDTGGSIRQPASFNGVYGFKPTYGTISRYGVVAMASSTDCIGFITKSPEDMDLLMEICAGQDPKDMTTLPDFYQNSGDKKIQKIGIVKELQSNAVDQRLRDALKTQVEKLKNSGHEVVEVSMPALKYALAAYYIIVPAEISSNLSRHDGIRYGYRAGEEERRIDLSLSDIYGKSRADGFMPENKRRIMIGNFVLSAGFYDAYYLKAQKARTVIINEFNSAFKDCDAILMPISPSPAFKLGEKLGDPVSLYLEDMFSVPTNLAGVPALAIPVGETEEGLPLGLQLIGPRRSDKSLINFAKELKEEK